MSYVSCRYAPPPPPEMQDMAKPGGVNPIICTDENGDEWHLTDASEVGDWVRFVEQGGIIEPAMSAKPAEA